MVCLFDGACFTRRRMPWNVLSAHRPERQIAKKPAIRCANPSRAHPSCATTRASYDSAHGSSSMHHAALRAPTRDGLTSAPTYKLPCSGISRPETVLTRRIDASPVRNQIGCLVAEPERSRWITSSTATSLARHLRRQMAKPLYRQR